MMEAFAQPVPVAEAPVLAILPLVANDSHLPVWYSGRTHARHERR